MGTGKPPGRPPAYDWDSVVHLMGKVTDDEIAKILGTVGRVVGKRRRQLGIPSLAEQQDLERRAEVLRLSLSMTADVIAEKTGLTLPVVDQILDTAVFHNMRPLPRPTRRRIDWSKVEGLGVEPVGDIAARLGCSRQAVFDAEKRLGVDRAGGRVRKSRSRKPKRKAWTKDRLGPSGIDWPKVEGLGTDPVRDIAKRLGCSRQAVYDAEKKLGVDRK